ncbi:MAG: DUF58 domain-containing protein [Actinomycetota bacterium]
MAITGRAALATLLGGIAVALVRPSWTATMAWWGTMITAIVVDLLVAVSPRNLSFTRVPGGTVRLGETTSVTLTVRNTGRRRIRGIVRDAWQPSAGAATTRHRLTIHPGDGQRVRAELRPVRRGDLTTDLVTVRSFGPLQLAARQRSFRVPGRIRVLPPFTSRIHLPSRLARLREIDGRSAINVRGQGTEFDSLRDYVPGDDVRSIDWRATARRSHVVVRTWRPERDRQVLLVLDASRAAAARVDDQPRLDAAMDAALLLAALAGHAGDRVGLLAIDRRVRLRVRGTNRTTSLASIARAMANVEATLIEADGTAWVSAIANQVSGRALVVLLTPVESGSVEQSLLPVLTQLTHRHVVVIASVSDPQQQLLAERRDTPEEVYDAAAAQRAELERNRITRLLTSAGAEVVHAGPADLPPRLADTYLALKAAGRL